jgi:hypothetical protein
VFGPRRRTDRSNVERKVVIAALRATRMTKWILSGRSPKYHFRAGSELFRVAHWKRIPKYDLKSLIFRFATREQQCCRRSASPYRWRKRRLGAVAVYEARFERVPDTFRNHKLPRMKSYYVHNGRYVWPNWGKPGASVWVSGPVGKIAVIAEFR